MHPNGDDKKQDEKRRHHDFIDFFNSLQHPGGENQNSNRHHNQVPGHVAERAGHLGKESFRFRYEDFPSNGTPNAFQDPADNDGISDGDAK